MVYVLLALGAAFCAFCIWLMVRIVNRRKDSDNEFLAVVCIAVLLLLLVIVPPIGLYVSYQSATRPKGAAKTLAAPPPARPPGR